MRPLLMKIAMFVILVPGAACGDDWDATEQFNRGLQYHKEKNYKEALKYYEKAAEKGHTGAQSELVTLYYDIGLLYHKEKNYKEALKYYEKAAEKGHTGAQSELVTLYYDIGLLYDEKKDYRKALEWFARAAKEGHTGAKNKLVTYYLNEFAIERDIERENRIILLDAQRGDANSQYTSGEKIYGVGRYEEAYYWLSLAKKKEKDLEQRYIDSLNTRLYELEDLIDDQEKINKLQEQTGDWKPKQPSYKGGSGFYIKKDLILTNEHVIRDCNEVYVQGQVPKINPSFTSFYFRVDVKKENRYVDLALLELSFPIIYVPKKLKNLESIPADVVVSIFENVYSLLFFPASFRSESISLQLGEDIAVFGYPLPGSLSFEGNFTIGNVSSTKGRPGINPSDYFQFTAPIQKGNSGGPVLDAAGNVVGVAMEFLPDRYKNMNVAQNINFAVSLKAIGKFLKDAKVEPDSLSSSDTRKEWTEIARAAQGFTVPVLCFKDKP